MEDHISLPVDKDDVSGDQKPFVRSIECRICQDEDIIKNLEAPCACRGSLKFAHRKCVQRWCNEKRDIICEICHQPYKPDYTAPPPQSNDTLINISGNLAFNDPRVSVTPVAESDYDEVGDNNANGSSFYRPAAFMLMVLLILRHALIIGDDDYDAADDPTIYFALFLLRAAGFLLPCYIMLWLISMVRRCRESQEEEDETLAAANVPFMNHEEQHRGSHVTRPTTPTPTYTPPVNPTHDTLQ
ncbi:uncharacterized protein LOC143556053 isoform X2 [Bidens hawaiensis]